MDNETGGISLNKRYFLKSFLLTFLFLILTPLTIALSAFTLIVSAQEQNISLQKTLESKPNSGARLFASLPGDYPEISFIPYFEDARTEILKQYLTEYDSPLLGLENYLVEKADENDLDFRLLTAIARKESSLCKIMPEDSYNCWGWGIHSQGTLRFSSYEEAIDVVSRGIKHEYVDKGFKTPEDIMAKYTPLSNGSWAEGVLTFMKQME